MNEDRKILIIDADTLRAAKLCIYLTGKGYKMYNPVNNYIDAIDILDKMWPYMVILDMQLENAGKTGLDIAQRLQKFTIFLL